MKGVKITSANDAKALEMPMPQAGHISQAK